jgi:hypothetical protein
VTLVSEVPVPIPFLPEGACYNVTGKTGASQAFLAAMEPDQFDPTCVIRGLCRIAAFCKTGLCTPPTDPVQSHHIIIIIFFFFTSLYFCLSLSLSLFHLLLVLSFLHLLILISLLLWFFCSSIIIIIIIIFVVFSFSSSLLFSFFYVYFAGSASPLSL